MTSEHQEPQPSDARSAPMPRYFFDTNDGEAPVRDSRGYELKGIEAARRFAQDALTDMARDTVPNGGPEKTMTVEVRDEAGKAVLRASLVLTVEILP